MPYCPKCGVEVRRDNAPCPLCRFPIPKIDESEQEVENRFPSAANPHPEYLKRKLLVIFRYATILMFVSVSLMLYINFKIEDAFTWSKYSGMSVFAGWGFLFFSFAYVTNFYKSFVGITGVALAFLFGVDMFQGGTYWFIPLALPIVAGVSVIVMGYYRLYQSLHIKGFNIIGFAFIAILILCLWTDFFISRYINQTSLLSWSIDAAIQLLPIALVMLYITYGLPERIKKKLIQKIIRRFHL